MICKDSVFKWFKGLSSHNRIDLMCSLLNKCLPFELRFLGTCLEDLGRQDFTQMKDFEVKANNVNELNDFQSKAIISETRTRQKLAVYVCLLHSLNTSCSSIIYKCLYGIDINEAVATAKTYDERILEELLTIYTVAVNHPAFSFEQRQNLGSILLRLNQEDNRLKAEKLAEAVSADYVQAQLANADNLDGSRSLLTNDMPPQVAPPGYPPPTGGFIPIPVYSSFPTQLAHQPIIWQWVNHPYPPISSDGTIPGHDGSRAFTPSPLLSRHSSPSQSAQHSRTASPIRVKNFYPRGVKQNYSNPVVKSPSPSIDRAEPVVIKHVPVADEPDMVGLAERMADMTTEMLHGAAVSLNGIIAPNTVARPLHCEPDVAVDGVCYTDNNFSSAVPTMPPPPPVRSNVLHTTSRFNNQSVGVTQNSHVYEDGRHSSSSASDASSASHSPPSTPANFHHRWEKGGQEFEEAAVFSKPRIGTGRGRGRMPNPPVVQTIVRDRGPPARGSVPTSHFERKTYVPHPPGGDIVSPTASAKPPELLAVTAQQVQYSPHFVPTPTAAAPPPPPTPFFPPYPPTFVRPPYSYPNGDVVYAYQPQPPTPFLPSHIVAYSSTVPPPKIACYNCSSQTHHPNDCKEPTMEEYSSKGQYKIDYGKANEMVNVEK